MIYQQIFNIDKFSWFICIRKRNFDVLRRPIQPAYSGHFCSVLRAASRDS